jgi:hypothetical protein
MPTIPARTSPYGWIMAVCEEGRNLSPTNYLRVDSGEKTRAEIRDFIVELISAKFPEVHQYSQNHIYAVQTLDMASFRLPPEEQPVLPGCRLGYLLHDQLYGADLETLSKALDQVLERTPTGTPFRVGVILTTRSAMADVVFTIRDWGTK